MYVATRIHHYGFTRSLIDSLQMRERELQFPAISHVRDAFSTNRPSSWQMCSAVDGQTDVVLTA